MRSDSSLVTLLLLVLGCGQQPLGNGTFELTEGEDSDAWTLRPRPVQVLVHRELTDGKLELVADLAVPVRRVEIPWGATGRFRITGADQEGHVRVATRSVGIDPIDLADLEIPLFVGRSDSFSRPPGRFLTPPGARPASAKLGQRYLLVARSIDDERILLGGYDFLLWRMDDAIAEVTCPSSPCRFESLAVVGTTLFGVGSSWGIWLDLDSGASGDVVAPDAMGGFAEVAGGRTVEDDEGGIYIVGATRDDPPTDVILHVDSEGVLTARRLNFPRAGAATLSVPGIGLVVYGGNDTAPAAELLGAGETTASVLGYDQDPVVGAVLIGAGGDRAVRAGGRDASGAYAPSVEFDVDCLASCTRTELDFTVDLESAVTCGSLGKRVLVAGIGDDGSLQTVAVEEGHVQPLPAREPRRDAVALEAPTGHLAVLGGETQSAESASSIELVLP